MLSFHPKEVLKRASCFVFLFITGIDIVKNYRFTNKINICNKPHLFVVNILFYCSTTSLPNSQIMINKRLHANIYAVDIHHIETDTEMKNPLVLRSASRFFPHVSWSKTTQRFGSRKSPSLIKCLNFLNIMFILF